jgi:hypothetical protein
VSHTGSIFEDSDENTALAIRRLLAVRVPERPGYHRELISNQYKFFAGHLAFFKMVRTSYSSYFTEYNGSEEEAVQHHADPHQKRDLRISAFTELSDNGSLYKQGDLWLRTVLWKMKKDEWAKPGKKPRMIGDLGVSASLRGFRLTNFLKIAQSEQRVSYLGGVLHFCKSPDPVEMQEVFDNLISPPGRFYFVYFSDDACFSVRCGDSVRMFNLDISSCDASHGPAIFDALRDMVPTHCKDDMQILIDQCTAPLRLVSKEDKRRVVVLKPNRPMLYSGSTITTAINNIANLCIGAAMAELEVYDKESMTQAAASAGYIVTGVEGLELVEDLQFLKHSPVRDVDGRFRPMMNIGVVMRASGACRGDLPGRGPLRDRAEMFQRGLLRGAYPHVGFPLLEAMKKAVGEGAHYVNEEMKTKVVLNERAESFVCHSSDVYRRYRLTPFEEFEMDNVYGTMSVGKFFNSSSVAKILQCDYGLSTQDR